MTYNVFGGAFNLAQSINPYEIPRTESFVLLDGVENMTIESY